MPTELYVHRRESMAAVREAASSSVAMQTDAVLAWCGDWVGAQPRGQRRALAAGRLCLDFLAVGGGLRAAVLIDAGHGGQVR